MTVDARWWGLARQAAARMSAPSDSVVRAIVGQWTCEQSTSSWPPSRNNPGNMARGAAAALSYPFSVAPGHNPQPGNPIVTFPSPTIGAMAYADGLVKFSRYAKAMRLARAGDGLGFVKAVCDAHYGTRKSCVVAQYARLGGTVPAGTTSGSSSSSPTSPAPSSGTVAIGTVVSLVDATLAADCAQVEIITSTNPLNGILGPPDAYPIPRDKIGKPCVRCAEGFNAGIVTPNALVDPASPIWGLIWTNPADVPGQANACVRADKKAGDSVSGATGVPGGIPDVLGGVAGAIAGIPAAVGGIVAHAGQVAILAAIGLLGLWLVVHSDS